MARESMTEPTGRWVGSEADRAPSSVTLVRTNGDLRNAAGKRLPQIDLELIAESIPHIVWMAGPDGATEYFNRRGTEYTGLPADANYDWAWVQLVHPDDAERA